MVLFYIGYLFLKQSQNKAGNNNIESERERETEKR